MHAHLYAILNPLSVSLKQIFQHNHSHESIYQQSPEDRLFTVHITIKAEIDCVFNV